MKSGGGGRKEVAALLPAEAVAVVVGLVHVQAEVVQPAAAASASSPEIVPSSGKSQVATPPVPGRSTAEIAEHAPAPLVAESRASRCMELPWTDRSFHRFPKMEETLEKLTVIYHQTGDHVERAAHIT
ncbi:hypothetical protein OPV22_019480 [Ensete ventricosum]|uniref:Uncharacterized protein n=1 Tax=Ensete ventricosum TaxID=4639 RepID=A0AAV8QMV4_ENSVE|nr:hypothetical protein OPV22_019480 [Ensete ventricosum]